MQILPGIDLQQLVFPTPGQRPNPCVGSSKWTRCVQETLGKTKPLDSTRGLVLEAGYLFTSQLLPPQAGNHCVCPVWWQAHLRTQKETRRMCSLQTPAATFESWRGKKKKRTVAKQSVPKTTYVRLRMGYPKIMMFDQYVPH